MELEQLDGAVDRLVFVLESPAYWNDLKEKQRQMIMLIKREPIKTREMLAYLSALVYRHSIATLMQGFEIKVDFDEKVGRQADTASAGTADAGSAGADRVGTRHV